MFQLVTWHSHPVPFQLIELFLGPPPSPHCELVSIVVSLGSLILFSSH